ncbi:hypothetical protein [Glycomyces sp. NRRL B-16210]|uniref:hypothetical protein n=1 Tax=Glycomyces sp. NRRL B-16210 TaxID=1463821 RepID=UPI0004BFCDAE|nr:hypothetical protein [Glycomyces sp. NRRL B-16210]
MSKLERQGRPDSKPRRRGGAIFFGTALAVLALTAVVAWQSELFGLVNREPQWEVLYTERSLTLEPTGANLDGGRDCWWEAIDLDASGEISVQPSFEGDPGAGARTDLAWWYCIDEELQQPQIRFLTGRDADGVWMRGAGLYTIDTCTRSLEGDNSEQILEAPLADLNDQGVRTGSAVCVRTTAGNVARVMLTDISVSDTEVDRRFSFLVTLWQRTD